MRVERQMWKDPSVGSAMLSRINYPVILCLLLFAQIEASNDTD